MISFLPSILGLVLSADEESCFSTLAGPVLLVGLLPLTRLLVFFEKMSPSTMHLRCYLSRCELTLVRQRLILMLFLIPVLTT